MPLLKGRSPLALMDLKKLAKKISKKNCFRCLKSLAESCKMNLEKELVDLFKKFIKLVHHFNII